MTAKTILVIPDAHASPKHNNDRFDILGKLIIDEKPDVIVNIGDFADMESLCSYDKGKKSYEGRRYKKDIEATLDAQNRLFAPMRKYNKRRAKLKKKQYKPELILTLGNHEERINRATELHAELDGTIGIEDLQYTKNGWSVHPFGSPVFVNGVAFSHCFSSGVMGRPISGEHQAHSFIVKKHMSCVAGHTHTRDFCERTTADGRRIQGLVVGCYLDEDQYESYAGESNKMWWKGVVILRDVVNGSFEPEFINIKQLKEQYT